MGYRAPQRMGRRGPPPVRQTGPRRGHSGLRCGSHGGVHIPLCRQPLEASLREPPIAGSDAPVQGHFDCGGPRPLCIGVCAARAGEVSEGKAPRNRAKRCALSHDPGLLRPIFARGWGLRRLRDRLPALVREGKSTPKQRKQCRNALRGCPQKLDASRAPSWSLFAGSQCHRGQCFQDNERIQPPRVQATTRGLGESTLVAGGY
mmetsp:Transcript_10061/g.22231  ORF Transcript_10061/g.22231 Transcript_10061/m.22231 type:complete len:204 (-) Transcript_10061:757-1368(-)